MKIEAELLVLLALVNEEVCMRDDAPASLDEPVVAMLFELEVLIAFALEHPSARVGSIECKGRGRWNVKVLEREVELACHHVDVMEHRQVFIIKCRGKE